MLQTYVKYAGKPRVKGGIINSGTLKKGSVKTIA